MDYQSDASELTDNELDQGSKLGLNSGKLEEKMQTLNGDTLFQVSKNKTSFSYLRRGRGKSEGNNPFTQGLNKLTFGGFEKVSSGLDKLKGFVTNPSEPRRRKKKGPSSASTNIPNTTSKGDVSESDVDISDLNMSPIDNVVPALQVLPTESDEFEIPNSPPQDNNTPPLQEEGNVGYLENLKNGVSFKETDIFVQPTVISKISLDWINQLLLGIWSLHRETILGPWKLGPINTNSYERVRLEDSFLELFSEIFELNYRQNWLYTQLHYFLKPVVLSLGGHVINRFALPIHQMTILTIFNLGLS
jgi:hypothetical protein